MVVYGHSSSTGWGIGNWIYSFHMPMFFFISGYLLKKPRREEKAGDLVKQQAYGLLPPYLIFALIGYLFWFLLESNFEPDAEMETSPLLTFLMIFYGSGSFPDVTLHPIVLWFFPCLLVSQVFCLLVSRYKTSTIIAISAITGIIGFLLPRSIVLPFEIETALVAQLFVVAGYLSKEARLLADMETWNISIPLVLLLLGGFLAFNNESIDMRSSQYENIPIFIASAVSTTLGFVALFARIKGNRLSAWVSRNTVMIFPLHPMVFTLLSGVYVFGLGLDHSVRENPVVGVVASLLNCLLILLFAVPLFKKFLPATYGLKGRAILANKSGQRRSSPGEG